MMMMMIVMINNKDKLLLSILKLYRGSILKDLEKDIIRVLSELSYNILYGNIPISTKRKKALAPYKQTLVKFTRRSTRLAEKRKLLSQKGGFLLPLLVPLITSLLL